MKKIESNHDNSETTVSKLDHVLALPTFCIALAFLILCGFVIHLEPDPLSTSYGFHQSLRIVGAIGLLGLYFLLVAETYLNYRVSKTLSRRDMISLIIPFMKLCPRDHVDGSQAWIVGVGWQQTDKQLEDFLRRIFSGPMIVIALLVLPVVGAELMWGTAINQSLFWRYTIQAATSLIWMAFVFEFVVMLTVVEKKVRYCKKNWIDIAVILLPFVAFLRAARLGRLVKLQQLTRTARVYRVRGLILRAWRAVVTLDVIDKLIRRDTDVQIDRLEQMIAEKELELTQMRRKLQVLEDQQVVQLGINQKI